MSTVVGVSPEAIVRLEPGALVLLDQTRLPGEVIERRYTSWQDVIPAIRSMVVRGAPAIGITAAYGVALAATADETESLATLRETVERACKGLEGSRPTAVNLRWAIDRMRVVAAEPHADAQALRDALGVAAADIHREEVERCVAIGDHGSHLSRDALEAIVGA